MSAITTADEKTVILSHDPSAGGSSDFDVGGGNDIAANTATDATIYSNPAEDELIEVTDVELFPPRNSDGSLQDWDYLTFLANGRETVSEVRAKPFQLPYFDTGPGSYQALRTSLGEPVLRIDTDEPPLTAKSSITTACPKYNYGEDAGLRVHAGSSAISDSFAVRVTYRKFQGSDADFRQNVGVSQQQAQISITARNPYRQMSQTFSRTVPLTMLGFDQFSGGMDASPPYSSRMVIAPTLTQATAGQNKRTPFTADNVDSSEDALWYNIAEKSQDAYVVENLSVNTTYRDPSPYIPSNQEAVIFELDHREDEDDTRYRAVNDVTNELPAPMPMDGNAIRSYGPDMKTEYGDGSYEDFTVPQTLKPTQYLFRDKGGLAVLDNGSSIPANSVTLGAWGYVLNLQ